MAAGDGYYVIVGDPTRLVKRDGDAAYILRWTGIWDRSKWAWESLNDPRRAADWSAVTDAEAEKIIARLSRPVRYFAIGEPKPVVAKVEGNSVSLWKDGRWQESNWAWAKLSGAGGDADDREITEAEAQKLMAASR
jgi:hypothetical protein